MGTAKTRHVPRVLTERVALQVQRHYRQSRGEAAPAAALARAQAALRKLLVDPKAYHSYVIRGGKVEQLVVAWRSRDDRDRRSAFVHPWLLATADAAAPGLEEELACIRAFFPATHRVVTVALFPEQQKLRHRLEGLGFRADALELIGRVGDGLAYTQRRMRGREPPGYALTPMDLRRDLAAVLRLEEAAHAAEPSSRAHGITGAAVARRMSGYFRKATADGNQTLLLWRDQELVGLIAMTYDPRRRQAAHIGSVCVDPGHQGKGLGTLLYRAAFEAMAVAGARFYFGHTTTDKVLHHAVALKRRVSLVFLTRVQS